MVTSTNIPFELVICGTPWLEVVLCCAFLIFNSFVSEWKMAPFPFHCLYCAVVNFWKCKSSMTYLKYTYKKRYLCRRRPRTPSTRSRRNLKSIATFFPPSGLSSRLIHQDNWTFQKCSSNRRKWRTTSRLSVGRKHFKERSLSKPMRS